ncbi:carbon-nitrogen hydrolase family protein [Bailinhaonella thermotolerans]|uniref:Carbon-nitrogen hydrolase family protein n=1 Tax=Bailinhaonella thermotolerans TaxID=1070861 RepID=A0A3A4ARR2_9ACTN|nr:carbon-nitrogen hydrolase family protein [Bailinhaonella thermotolerans]
MRAPLTIAVAQPGCEPYDVGANAAAHAELVRASEARVVVFPELSLTGYHLDAQVLDPGDPRLAVLAGACAETGTLALAGAPVADGEGLAYIGVLAITGEGARVAYRKMYLGGDETFRFTPGPAPVVLDVDGWRLGLAICKDTGVPEHAAATAARGMDVYVAGVLEHAHDGGVPPERALRVIGDHGVWAATASFAAPTGEGYTRPAAHSAIWSPDGAVAAAAGTEIGGLARATLT